MRPPTTLQQCQPPRIVRLLNGGAAALRAVGIGDRPLTAASLIAAAQESCGLDDFGPGDFFEPLSRLIESCRRDAGLNLIGRLALRADTLHCLRNRLLLERDRRAHPEIAQAGIAAPLFIVGLPRTGTTILHTLLTADAEHRAPLTWEVMEPSPLGELKKKERVRRASRNLAGLRWLAPAFPKLHAVGAELPQECVSLMSLSFLSDQFDTMYNIPAYRAWFFEQDLTPAYQWHRRFLEHLQFGRKPCRWILKAPTHMFALPRLLATYPDACFVQTHRAPLDAMTSVSSLITILRRIFSDSVDPVRVGKEAMHYWAETLETFMIERGRLPAGRICDLPYADIKRNPIAAVAKIYAHFGWPLSSETRERMERILVTQPPEQVTFHRYEPGEFGLESVEIAGLFASYCDRFDMPVREEKRMERGSPSPLVEEMDFSLAQDLAPNPDGATETDQRQAMIG